MTTLADESYIDGFKRRAKNWASDVMNLFNTEVPPAMEGEKASLLKTAGYIKKGVESIFGTFDELENVGLGIIPVLIPLAVIGASLAAITKWSLDYKKFMAKLAEQKRLESIGVDPLAASQIIERQAKASNSWLNIDSKTLVPLGLAAGIYLWVTKG